MPLTAPKRTSLACLNADSKFISFPRTSNNFSLGTIIRESTLSLSNLIPSFATSIRFLPSNEKGLVTTPTVRIPICFAISATMGAPPVPVPPPIPAVIKTISAPLRTCDIRSLSSRAACRPTSGFAPAPKPLVKALPN